MDAVGSPLWPDPGSFAAVVSAPACPFRKGLSRTRRGPWQTFPPAVDGEAPGAGSYPSWEWCAGAGERGVCFCCVHKRRWFFSVTLSHVFVLPIKKCPKGQVKLHALGILWVGEAGGNCGKGFTLLLALGCCTLPLSSGPLQLGVTCYLTTATLACLFICLFRLPLLFLFLSFKLVVWLLSNSRFSQRALLRFLPHNLLFCLFCCS